MDSLAFQVRHAVYAAFARCGRRPSVEGVAAVLDLGAATVREAFAELAAARILVLEPDTGEIDMAIPFAGVPRSNWVEIGDRRYEANCAWDTLGILAALGEDGVGWATCPDCDEPLHIERSQGVIHGDVLVHFVVPAARWWDDIRFT